MAAKREVPNADNLVRRYLAGEHVGQLREEFGVSDILLGRLLRDAGVERRTFQQARAVMRGRPREKRRWAPAGPAAVVSAYLEGVSEKALADSHGVSRAALRAFLLRNGVEPRGRSAAETLKWQAIRATPGGIERQCGRAWAAADAMDVALEAEVKTLYGVGGMALNEIAGLVGTTRSNVKRIVRKLGLTANGRCPERVARGHAASTGRPQSSSPYEQPIIAALRRRGLHPVHQFAVGPCNVDLAFPELSIAVEVERRYRSDSRSLQTQRLEHLLSRGWGLIVVYSPRKLPIDAEGVAEQIVAILDGVGPHPSCACQYWVVARDGKDFPGRGPNLDRWTRVRCPHP